MKSKALSIIVPCYNAEKTIIPCIKSILRAMDNLTEILQYEIIIVNDGSTDNTLSLLEKINDITIINHNENQGLASARNTGIEKSDSEYLVFIDSDIFIEKTWIHTILAAFNNNKNIIGITGSLLLPPNKKPTILDRYLFSSYRGAKKINSENPLKYKWFVFSNTIVRRKALIRVGNFDENLRFYGGEDTELAIRIDKVFPESLRQENASIGYHYSNKKLEDYLNNMFEYGKYNFYKIINKHPDYKQQLGSNIINSFLGYLFFNPIARFQCALIFKIVKHPLLIKFLVIDSFVRGARQAEKNI